MKRLMGAKRGVIAQQREDAAAILRKQRWRVEKAAEPDENQGCLIGKHVRKELGRELVRAAHNGDIRMTEELLGKGAEVDEWDHEGQTALIAATAKGHREIVEILLANGAGVDFKPIYGETALIVASSCGHKNIAKILLASGADMNERDDQGWKALMMAYEFSKLEMVEYLLSNGADVDERFSVDEEEKTILMMAVGNNDWSIAKIFLRHGAKPDARDANGRTLLSIAVNRGHDEVARLLKEYGAKE